MQSAWLASTQCARTGRGWRIISSLIQYFDIAEEMKFVLVKKTLIDMVKFLIFFESRFYNETKKTLRPFLKVQSKFGNSESIWKKLEIFTKILFWHRKSIQQIADW